MHPTSRIDPFASAELDKLSTPSLRVRVRSPIRAPDGRVYDTGPNDPTGTGDSCPQSSGTGSTSRPPARSKRVSTVKNGPRLWCLDWIEGMTGAERDFSGLKAHSDILLDVIDEMLEQGASAYTPPAAETSASASTLAPRR